MNIKKELWGKTPCGKEIFRYTLKNGKGAYVQLSNVGAGIVSVVVPDKDGVLADVVLGYDDPMNYFGDGPCAGKIPGRFANRIALGKFELDGKEYTLPINNGPNHLHGGPEGFQNKLWESREHEGGVEFLYYSEDGEMGYPGAVKTVARYDWSEENELRLTLTAESDAPTVINLTNHAYFNLNGEGNGDILGHHLRLNASEYLPTDPTQIPLGESEPVAGTPMDFVNAKPIGQDIKVNDRVGDVFDLVNNPEMASAYEAYTKYAEKGVTAENISDAKLGRLHTNAYLDAQEIIDSKEVAELLIKHGAEVNCCIEVDNDHYYPLSAAAEYNAKNVAEVLLNHGAITDTIEEGEGYEFLRPIDYAIKNNSIGFVEVYLNHGYEIDGFNVYVKAHEENSDEDGWEQEYGTDPIAYAEKHNFTELAELLKKHLKKS